MSNLSRQKLSAQDAVLVVMCGQRRLLVICRGDAPLLIGNTHWWEWHIDQQGVYWNLREDYQPVMRRYARSFVLTCTQHEPHQVSSDRLTAEWRSCDPNRKSAKTIGVASLEPPAMP